MYRELELQYKQWWHSKVLKTDCSVRKNFKSRIWNTQAASYNFLGMYQGMNQQNFLTIHLNISFRVHYETYFFMRE